MFICHNHIFHNSIIIITYVVWFCHSGSFGMQPRTILEPVQKQFNMCNDPLDFITLFTITAIFIVLVPVYLSNSSNSCTSCQASWFHLSFFYFVRIKLYILYIFFEISFHLLLRLFSLLLSCPSTFRPNVTHLCPHVNYDCNYVHYKLPGILCNRERRPQQLQLKGGMST